MIAALRRGASRQAPAASQAACPSARALPGPWLAATLRTFSDRQQEQQPPMTALSSSGRRSREMASNAASVEPCIGRVDDNASSFTYKGNALDRKHDFTIDNLIQKGSYDDLEKFCLDNMAIMNMKRISVVFKKLYEVHLDAARQHQYKRAKEKKKITMNDTWGDDASVHIKDFMVSPVPTSDAMLEKVTARVIDATARAVGPVQQGSDFVSMNCVSDLMKALDLYPVHQKNKSKVALSFLRAMAALIDTVPSETAILSSCRTAFMLHSLQHNDSDSAEVRLLIKSLLQHAGCRGVLLTGAKDITVASHALCYMRSDCEEVLRLLDFLAESIAACPERFEPFHVARIMKGLRNMGHHIPAMRTILDRLAYELSNSMVTMKGGEVRMCLMGMRTAHVGNAKQEKIWKYDWASSKGMLAAINKKMEAMPSMTPTEIAAALHGLGSCVDTVEEVRTAIGSLCRVHRACMEKSKTRLHAFVHHDGAMAMRVFMNKDIKGNRDLRQLFAVLLKDIERSKETFDGLLMRDGARLGSMIFSMQGLLRVEGGLVYHPPALDFLDAVASRIHQSQHLHISAHNGNLSNILTGLRGLVRDDGAQAAPQLSRMLSAISRCMNTKKSGVFTFPEAGLSEIAEAIVQLLPFSAVDGAPDLLKTLRRQAHSCGVAAADAVRTRNAVKAAVAQAESGRQNAEVVRELSARAGLPPAHVSVASEGKNEG